MADPITQDWLVAFVSLEDAPPYTRWLRDGFHHVILLGFHPKTGDWTYFNWTSDSLELTRLSWDQATGVIAALGQRAGALVRYRRDLDEAGGVRIRVPFLYCVEVAKHLLGIDSFWCVTPLQLYRELVRSGAKVMSGGA